MSGARQGIARLGRRALLGLACVATATRGTRAGASTITLGEADNGRHLPARVGDTIVIRLPDNASTGYEWTLEDADGKLLQLVEKSTHYPRPGMPGAAGEAILTVRVVGAGSVLLALRRWRSWEGDASIIQRFAVTIDAAP